MMKPFFSIVVPCCNVAAYAGECIRSVREQSFRDWECLIVIEDSRDNTVGVVDEAVAGDPRFRIFKQPKSGSAAVPRNTGIDNAAGEYLIFLDGDDSIAENALAGLAEKISRRPGADLYACAIREYEDGTGRHIRIIDNFGPDAPAELSGHDAILMLYGYWRNPSPMVQENIHRVEFLRKNSLHFVPGLQHDDHEFFPREFFLAERIVPLHEVFYLYRRQTGSITMGGRAPGYFLKYMSVVLKSLFAFHAEVSARPGFDRRISRCWAREWVAWLFDWFYERNVRLIPREKRRETLSAIFSDGFDDFNLLVKAAAPPRRIAAWWVRVFVRRPSMAWMAEAFFKWYFRLAEARNRRRGRVLHMHGED